MRKPYASFAIVQTAKETLCRRRKVFPPPSAWKGALLEFAQRCFSPLGGGYLVGGGGVTFCVGVRPEQGSSPGYGACGTGRAKAIRPSRAVETIALTPDRPDRPRTASPASFAQSRLFSLYSETWSAPFAPRKRVFSERRQAREESDARPIKALFVPIAHTCGTSAAVAHADFPKRAENSRAHWTT